MRSGTVSRAVAWCLLPHPEFFAGSNIRVFRGSSAQECLGFRGDDQGCFELYFPIESSFECEETFLLPRFEGCREGFDVYATCLVVASLGECTTCDSLADASRSCLRAE